MSSLRRLPETGIFCIQQQRSTGTQGICIRQQRSTGTGDVFIQQQRNTGAGDVFIQQQRNTDTTTDSADGIPPGNCHQKHFRQTPQQLARNSHFDRYSRIHHRRAGGIPYLPDQQIAKTLTLSEPVTPTKVKPSKGFTVSTENGDFTVTFSSRGTDNDSTFETPEGYEILTVKYHVTVPQKALDTFPGQADENHLYTHWDSDRISPYCVTKDDSYLKPISNYDLSRVKHLEYSELEDNGTTDNIDSQNGTLSFLIKKNDFKGLLINELDPDTEVLANSYLVIGIPKQKK